MTSRAEHLDAAIARALQEDTRQAAPEWSAPDADWTFFQAVVAASPRRARRSGSWRWVGAAAVLAIAVGVLPRLLVRPSGPASPPSPLAVSLAQDAGAMLNQRISPSRVSVTQPAPGQAVLANSGAGRWRRVAFREVSGTWAPTAVVTVVAGLTLTYQVNRGPTDPSVVLSAKSMTVLEQHLAHQAYSSADSQRGALARLPIQLGAATPQYQTTPANQDKLLLQEGSMKVLALTYVVKTPSGTVFAPVGWFWWAGAPPIMQGAAAP